MLLLLQEADTRRLVAACEAALASGGPRGSPGHLDTAAVDTDTPARALDLLQRNLQGTMHTARAAALVSSVSHVLPMRAAVRAGDVEGLRLALEAAASADLVPEAAAELQMYCDETENRAAANALVHALVLPVASGAVGALVLDPGSAAALEEADAFAVGLGLKSPETVALHACARVMVALRRGVLRGPSVGATAAGDEGWAVVEAVSAGLDGYASWPADAAVLAASFTSASDARDASEAATAAAAGLPSPLPAAPFRLFSLCRAEVRLLQEAAAERALLAALAAAVSAHPITGSVGALQTEGAAAYLGELQAAIEQCRGAVKPPLLVPMLPRTAQSAALLQAARLLLQARRLACAGEWPALAELLLQAQPLQQQAEVLQQRSPPLSPREPLHVVTETLSSEGEAAAAALPESARGGGSGSAASGGWHPLVETELALLRAEVNDRRALVGLVGALLCALAARSVVQAGGEDAATLAGAVREAAALQPRSTAAAHLLAVAILIRDVRAAVAAIGPPGLAGTVAPASGDGPDLVEGGGGELSSSAVEAATRLLASATDRGVASSEASAAALRLPEAVLASLLPRRSASGRQLLQQSAPQPPTSAWLPGPACTTALLRVRTDPEAQQLLQRLGHGALLAAVRRELASQLRVTYGHRIGAILRGAIGPPRAGEQGEATSAQSLISPDAVRGATQDAAEVLARALASAEAELARFRAADALGAQRERALRSLQSAGKDEARDEGAGERIRDDGAGGAGAQDPDADDAFFAEAGDAAGASALDELPQGMGLVSLTVAVRYLHRVRFARTGFIFV